MKDSIRERIFNLSADRRALLDKKLKERRTSLPNEWKLSGSTESLDNGLLFERSLIRNQKLMQHDAQLQALKPSPAIVDELAEKCCNSIEFLALACRLYSDRPALGYRAFESTGDLPKNCSTVNYLPEFRTLTFAVLWDRITSLASGLAHIQKIKVQDRIGICGFASPDYLVVEFACLYLSVTSVPLQTNMPPKDLKHIINEAELCCLFCSQDMLSLIIELLPQCPTVRDLVVMDFNEDDDQQVYQFENQGDLLKKRVSNINENTIKRLELIGRQTDPAPMVIPAANTDPLMTIMYTSGSTGLPKGAIFTESIWRQYWRLLLLNFISEVPLIAVNFMPLNHLMSRMAVMRRLLHGGTTYFTLRSDMSTLLEDIRLVRPTILSLVPRVSQVIYQHYQMEILSRSAVLSDKEQQNALEQQVMAEMRTSYLGDRLLLLTNGSAPLAPEICTFLKRCFHVPVVDGYGSTEAGFISRDNRILSRNITDYKLVDVPELSCFTSDKPWPRGELRIKCRLSIPGYLKNPQASQELYDEQGYLKTGDIVEERGSGHVVWLDRLNNILKLSQGEFVSIWRLETIYAGSNPCIDQIYLYGNSKCACLLAVVVPNQDTVKSCLGLQHDQPEAIKQLVRKELNTIAGQHQLHSYEIPREFIIESEPFTKENGLLTESNKPSRPNLKAKYAERLESLYVHLENQQLQNIAKLQQISAAATTEERVIMALETTLGITNITINERFRDLGGDSLDSVYFSSLVQSVCGISLPVALILSPAATVQDIVDYLKERMGSVSNRQDLSFGELHVNSADKVSVMDLRLERFMTSTELSEACRLSLPDFAGKEKTLLLTGANGFLGRALTRELIDHLLRCGGKTYCLVRAKNNEAALSRMLDGFNGIDIRQRDNFLQLVSEKRISVLAGDLMKTQCGLDNKIYEQLAQEVDCIIHSAALVNHIFSYAQLFEPNVLGTVEVIRLALKTRLKSVNFISSAGVASGLLGDGMICENVDSGRLWQERATNGGYAAGYATSKWAGEVLLREAHELAKLPVNVFRCGMILSDSRQHGQINATDFLTRLLCGIVYTGLAPRSFYETSKTGVPAHFGGLPVDFVGRLIVCIATKPQLQYSTYHVVDPHRDDPVSLDLIVDWVESAGYQITRIADYSLWYQMFNDRLNALDGPQRRHSPLPIMHQWQRPMHAGHEMKLDTSRFIARLREINCAGEAEPVIPSISEDYISKWLKDMQQLGLIDPPRMQLTPEPALKTPADKYNHRHI